MGFEQVVVTLTPVYSPDTLPFRSLTFSSDNDTIAIGRASKSECKNLVPDHDNGWFNSRVMSRNHAVLSVRLESQAVYIRDHGSLHGTQLNDNRIEPRANVRVESGDVLTFGSEISRGPETFRPIAVRLDCQWHESKLPVHVKETTKPITNTFSVPDDEDDTVEIVEYREAILPKPQQNVSDSSDFDYGSDMSRPLDLTSPITSPEAKTSELPRLKVDESQPEPVTEDAPQVLSEPFHNEDDNSQLESEENGPNSDSDDSAYEPPKGFYEEDSESDESEEDHDEGDDLVEQEPPAGVQTPFRFMAPPKTNVSAPSQAPLVESPVPSSAVQQSCEPTPSLPEQPHPSAESANYTAPWPEYLIPRVPSPSDKAMAKPTNSTAPGYQPYNDNSSGFELWSNNQFAPLYPDAVNLTGAYGSLTANESFPFGPHRSSGYLRHTLGEVHPKPVENTNLLHSFTTGEKSSEPTKTGLSIADVVEKLPAEDIISNELKRKASEFECDLHVDSSYIGLSEEDSIPDAQPQPGVEIANSSQLDAVNVESNPTEEHRHKRIKKKDDHSFMKYATAAVIGAVVGSIGTIAGLASLPTDFFN